MLIAKLSKILGRASLLTDGSSINHISRRLIRNSRPPRRIPNEVSSAEQGEDDLHDADHHEERREDGREFRRDSRTRSQHYQEERPDREYRDIRHDDYDGGRPSQERDKFPAGPEGMQIGDRRKNVNKLIRDNSTYGTLNVKGTPTGDPFLTGPYVRGDKTSLQFHQGNDAVEESLRRKVDPSTTSVIMFPGQGTQYAGMCGEISSMPRYIQVMYEIASSILDYDLLDLCANGPKEKLDQTMYCQPAILVSSLAALESLKDTDPEMIDKCVAAAGFSIGEITALVFAGVISFEDAIRFVKVRSEAMQLASDMNPSGMATIIYGADSKLNYSLKVAREWCRREHGIENPVCSIANYLFPHCKVVAGHNEALDFLEMNYKDFNLRKVKRLPVSGAFHTELMQPAAEPLKAMLRTMTINRPRMPVFSNLSGYRYHSSDEVKKFLPKQICRPVMWEQILQNLYKRPKETEYPYSFECGPGSSLTTVLKQVNAKAHKNCKPVNP